MGFWDVLLFNIATVLGPRWVAAAAHNGTSSISLWILAALLFFLLSVSVGMLVVAVGLNIIGLNIGKWLQNAGGVSTYLPLLALLGIAAVLWTKHGPITHFTLANMMPVWNWDTVNFWSQIAFAFSGLELVSAMSQEVHNPQKTLPWAVYASGVLIAGMYIVATVAVLAFVPAAEVS